MLNRVFENEKNINKWQQQEKCSSWRHCVKHRATGTVVRHIYPYVHLWSQYRFTAKSFFYLIVIALIYWGSSSTYRHIVKGTTSICNEILCWLWMTAYLISNLFGWMWISLFDEQFNASTNSLLFIKQVCYFITCIKTSALTNQQIKH